VHRGAGADIVIGTAKAGASSGFSFGQSERLE
jgi:hypothetical protein